MVGGTVSRGSSIQASKQSRMFYLRKLPNGAFQQPDFHPKKKI